MKKKPNLVFILNDHQAWYGHGMQGGVKPLRPRFEAFAREGMEFDNAYCVTPMCGPARRSLLTGLYPHTHGQVHNENDPPYLHEVYLDTLAENGYANYYYGKWHAGPGCAYDHHSTGFSQSGYGNPYNTPEYAAYLKRKNLPRATHRIERVIRQESFVRGKYFKGLEEGADYRCEDYWCGEHAFGTTTTPKETHEAFFLADMACEKLEELSRNPDEPFALRVDFWGPHQPFFPTQEFIDMYDPAQIEPYPSFDSNLDGKPDVVKWEVNRPMGDGKHIIHPNPLPWTDWQVMLARCYAHGTLVDAAGGVVLDKLKELGLDENTIVIWSTDHGDALACQGGHFDKDSNLVQEVMRIPMALRWPGVVPPAKHNDDFVFTCDIPATLMDAAGLSFREPIAGRTLLDLADPSRENTPPWRDSLMCETYGHGYGLTNLGRMVVKGDWKYACFEKDLDELYNLKDDPYELENLSQDPAHREKRDEMRALLRKWQQETADPVPLEELLPPSELQGAGA